MCFLAAKKDPEGAPGERLLRRSQQLPKGPAGGCQQGERLCCQSQSQLQGVGGYPAEPCPALPTAEGDETIYYSPLFKKKIKTIKIA